MIKKLAKKIISASGYRIIREDAHRALTSDYTPYSQKSSYKKNIVDLSTVTAIAETIPGMITPLSGQLIYTLCYFQKERGDVVEIGSWQGRSASFLGRATSESQNGSFFAIDHFKGNPGKEHFYVVQKEDLSDLKSGFENNILRVGLSNAVTLLDMTNEDAAQVLKNHQIRFLLIDGDHSGPGVQKDMDLFFPLLVDGAIIVFDDYSHRFPGLIEAVDRFLAKEQYDQCMVYPNSLVLRYKKPS